MWQQLFGFLSRLISKLFSRPNSDDTSGTPSSDAGSLPGSSGRPSSREIKILWGQKVSQTFRDRITWTADALECDVNYLMCVIAFESGRTFRPDIRNAAGSGATGLIQFMPSTARGLGTSTDELALMSAEDQIRYVYKYLLPYKGRMQTLADVYMAVLWPAAIGKPEAAALWSTVSHPTTYRQNAGLDIDGDGVITKAEAAAKVRAMETEGERLAWTGVVTPN